MLFQLVTLPSGADLYTGISDYSGATFTNFYPIALYAVGFLVGGMILAFLIGIFRHAIERFFEGLLERFGMGSQRGGETVRVHTYRDGQYETDVNRWSENNYN